MPIEDEDHGRPVEQRARAQRREDPDRKRNREPEDEPSEDEARGHRGGALDHVVDLLTRRERAAERLVDDELLQEARILDRHGIVEAELLLDPLDVFRRRLRPGHETSRIRRHEEEDHPGDERDRKEQNRSPDDTPDEVLEHLADGTRSVKKLFVASASCR